MAVVRYKGKIGTSFDERNKYAMSRRNVKDHLIRERDQRHYAETISGAKKRPPRGSKKTSVGKAPVKRGMHYASKSSSSRGKR